MLFLPILCTGVYDVGGCYKSYCYVSRYNPDKVYINENTDQILQSVEKWVQDKRWPKIPNQTDPVYYTIDIGCSTDVALMSKHYSWQVVFDYFNRHERLKSTFATKYPTRMPVYDTDKSKNRIRVSLMPQIYSSILEPNTDSIVDRISSIPRLQEHFEVHINYSPIIYEEGWLQEYDKLFRQVAEMGIDIPCECIFLTYNDIQYERNSEEVNALCWKPDIQEHKNSIYAEDNIRYQWRLKNEMIQQFKELYARYFPIDSIRYIF